MCVRTPAQDDVPDQVFLQGEEGAAHQREQEVALHQQPAVVGQDGVVGEHQDELARHLLGTEGERAPGHSSCTPVISSYRVVVTVVELLISKQQSVSDEDEDGPQDEGEEELDVDVVPGAVELPEQLYTIIINTQSALVYIKHKQNILWYIFFFKLMLRHSHPPTQLKSAT